MTDERDGRIRPVPIEEELKSAYLDYAMSVIVSRALPDVRDGLKPVHRRILFTMNEMGLSSTSAYRKCAAIVGEVASQLWPLIESGTVRPVVHEVFPVERTADAHRAMEQGGLFGKLVLRMP